MGSATTYTVTPDVSNKLFTARPDDCFLYNDSDASIYLDSYPGVTTINGMRLAPRSSKVWVAGSDCYAISDSGTTARLNVSDNSGDVVNPAAVAASLVDSGFANDVAAAIYITGAPPVDKYTMLNDSDYWTNSYQSQKINVTSYQSLQIYFYQGLPANWVMIAVQWFDSADTVLLATDRYIMGIGQPLSPQQISQPVKGALCRIYAFELPTASGGSSVGFRVRTFGSFKSVNKKFMLSYGAGAVNGNVDGQGNSREGMGVQTWDGNLPFGATWLWQPDVIPGRTRIVIRFTTGGVLTTLIRVPTAVGTFGLTTYVSDSNRTITTTSGAGAQQVDYGELILPAVPLEISLANSATSGTLNFRVTVTNDAPFV